MAIKHNFVCPLSDGVNADQVRPSNWNADHSLLDADSRNISFDDVISYENVKFSGAAGDGATDDSDAIDDAIDSAVANHKVLYFPKVETGYIISAKVSIPKDLSVIMDSPVIYLGSSNITLIEVGEQGVANQCQRLDLQAKRQELSDWTSENSIGIKIINPYTCNINIISTWYNTIGVKLVGDGYGAAYNNIALGRFWGNKIGLDLDCQTYETVGGWCNENVFWGGRFGVGSAHNTSTSRYGVRLKSGVAGKYPNNNLFLKPSFELGGLSVIGGAKAVPLYIDNGVSNEFLSCRDENNSPSPFGYVKNNSAYNKIVTYGTDNPNPVLTDTSSAGNSLIMTRLQEITALASIL